MAKAPATQIVVGPQPDMLRGLCTDRRLGVNCDLVHYWRATLFSERAATQPRTLCNRRVMFGKHYIAGNQRVCWLCRYHLKRQQGVGRL